MISPFPNILPLGPKTFMSRERQLPPLSTQLPDILSSGRPTSPPATPDNSEAFRHSSPKRKPSDEGDHDGDIHHHPTKRAMNEVGAETSPRSLQMHETSASALRSQNASPMDAQQGAQTGQPVRLPPMRTILGSSTGEELSPGSSWTWQGDGYRREAFGRYQEGQARANPLQPPRDPGGPRIMTSDLAQYQTSNDRQSYSSGGDAWFPRPFDRWQNQSGGDKFYPGPSPPYSRSHSKDSTHEPISYPWQHDTYMKQHDNSDTPGYSDDQPPRHFFEAAMPSRSNSDPMDRWREHRDSHQSMTSALSDTKSPQYHSETPSQYTWEIPGTSEQAGRKRRGNLPKESTAILNDWFNNHVSYPYPKEEEKQDLQNQTGLTMAQISNWFINARRRRRPATSNKDEELTDEP